MATSRFNEDIAAFVRWCTALEAEVNTSEFAVNRSRWYYSEAFNLYTRCGWSFLGSVRTKAVMLANVTVKEDLQGQGLLSALLDQLEHPSSGLEAPCVVLEQVMNPRLVEMLGRRGYRERAPGELAPTLFKFRAR